MVAKECVFLFRKPCVLWNEPRSSRQLLIAEFKITQEEFWRHFFAPSSLFLRFKAGTTISDLVKPS